MRVTFLSLFLYLISLSSAFAFCMEPSKPIPPYDEPPKPPFCAGSFGSGLGNCSKYDIERYRKKVEEYIESMQQYADEASRFSNRAIEFANCRAEEAVENWNKFVGK